MNYLFLFIATCFLSTLVNSVVGQNELFTNKPYESEYAYLSKDISDDHLNTVMEEKARGIGRDIIRVFKELDGKTASVITTLEFTTEPFRKDHQNELKNKLRHVVVKLDEEEMRKIVDSGNPELMEVLFSSERTPTGTAVPVAKEIEVLEDIGIAIIHVNPATYAVLKEYPEMEEEIMGTYVKMASNIFSYQYAKTVQADQRLTLFYVDEPTNAVHPHLFWANSNSDVTVPCVDGLYCERKSDSNLSIPIPCETTDIPDDPYYAQNQYGPQQMKCDKAWTKVTGKDTRPLVAVIDTGIDQTHPDLKDNLWVNPFGKDDPMCPGGTHGCYFPPGEAPGNGNYTDSHGHGTHVAGTIGAVGNNKVGVAGVLWGAQIMAVKANWLTSVVKAFLWAGIIHGAKVSNSSWGFGGPVPALKHTLNAVGKRGGHVAMFAASNEGKNMDISNPLSYPQVYYPELENMANVAASTEEGNRASYSNYGVKYVPIAAPGDKIFSTYPLSKKVQPKGYTYLSGTSMACPHAVGVIGLLLAAYPSFMTLTAEKVLQILYKGAKSNADWKGIVTYGLLDAYAVLKEGAKFKMDHV